MVFHTLSHVVYEIVKKKKKNPITFSQSSMWPIIPNPKYLIYNDKKQENKSMLSLLHHPFVF